MAIKAIDIVLDSFAWVEYLRGTTPHGRMVEAVLGSSSCGTPILALAELSDRYQRERLSGLDEALDFIELRTAVLPLTRAIAQRAGKTKAEMRRVFPDVPLADAIVYETAREHQAELLTGDPHFRRMERVRFLPSR